MDELGDLELVEFVKAGHEDAFDVLLARYESLIMAIARSYYGTSYDEKDFFQFGSMAFLRAIRRFERNKDVSFYTYVLRCVRNEIVERYREAMRKVEYAFDASNIRLIMEPRASYEVFETEKGPSCFNSDATFKRREMVKKALGGRHILSERERVCLERFLLGHSYDDIEKELGLNRKQIDNALSRCKVKLQALEEEGN